MDPRMNENKKIIRVTLTGCLVFVAAISLVTAAILGLSVKLFQWIVG